MATCMWSPRHTHTHTHAHTRTHTHTHAHTHTHSLFTPQVTPPVSPLSDLSCALPPPVPAAPRLTGSWEDYVWDDKVEGFPLTLLASPAFTLSTGPPATRHLSHKCMHTRLYPTPHSYSVRCEHTHTHTHTAGPHLSQGVADLCQRRDKRGFWEHDLILVLIWFLIKGENESRYDGTLIYLLQILPCFRNFPDFQSLPGIWETLSMQIRAAFPLLSVMWGCLFSVHLFSDNSIDWCNPVFSICLGCW